MNNSEQTYLPPYFPQIRPEDSLFPKMLERRAKEQGNQTFFTFLDQSFSYEGFNAQVNAMARCLQNQGIKQGDTVAVLMTSSADYLCLWFALAKVGAVEVPINTAYHGDILLHQLKTSGASACVVDGQFANAVEAVINNTAVKVCFVRGDKQEIPAGFLSFALLQQAEATDNLTTDIHYSHTCGIIFTSGTTGPSKGVLLSFRYLTAYGIMYADINGLKDDDVVMNFLPFFHLSGKFLTIATLVGGGSMRLQERLSISGFMGEVNKYNITNFLGVGGICNMLLSRPESPTDKECSIRTIYAVPDPADMHLEIEKRFNCDLTTVFGSTEVGLPLFRSVRDGYEPGSCGRMSPYYDVRIVDEYDNEVPVGETGEIVVRPKEPYLVASGYVGMAEKTVDAWRNLWFHSGDSGRKDENGWFFFEDRVSDSLRRRGENISSYEVETLVAKFSGVSEVAAVAYPSELGEDEVRIFVVAREGASFTAEQLFEHCCQSMPYFMVPRYIDIVDQFPRTPTAKVEKYKLRKAEKTDATWDSVAQGWQVKRDGVSKIA